jgi:hypothetical protein
VDRERLSVLFVADPAGEGPSAVLAAAGMSHGKCKRASADAAKKQWNDCGTQMAPKGFDVDALLYT